MKVASGFALALSCAAVAFSSPVEKRDNPDAKTNYLKVVDETLPNLFKDYNAALDKFVQSDKTVEDIDDLYQFSRTIFDIQVLIIPAISYVDVEIIREYPTAAEANRTVFASLPKLEALLEPVQTAMNKVSSIEDAILAHGKAGHAAIFSSLVAQANTWYNTVPFPKKLTQPEGRDSAISDIFVKLGDISDKVRDQYNRPGYCQECYPF